MADNDKQKLQKIYEANKKIELKGNITGHVAKRLMNNCLKALSIVEKYETAHLEKNLHRCIIELEDELAERDKISTITYNLGARTQIHVATEWVTRWRLKDD